MKSAFIAFVNEPIGTAIFGVFLGALTCFILASFNPSLSLPISWLPLSTGIISATIAWIARRIPMPAWMVRLEKNLPVVHVSF